MSKSIYDEAQKQMNVDEINSNNEERNAYAQLVKERIIKFFDDLTLDEQLEIEKQIKELENE